MLYEAVNGYSIVFSGAILKTNLTKVFGDLRGVANFTFTKVKDIADLNEMDAVKDKAGHFKMGILC